MVDYREPLFFRVMKYASDAEHDVIDMVSGNPDWAPPPALLDGLRNYAGREPSAFQYPASEGLGALRGEIAQRRNVPFDSVIVTNGAGEANYLAMARALERDAGTEVILTDPVYPYYSGRTGMLGGEPVFVACRTDGSLDLTAIREQACDETALIVINNPNNPTGAVYDPDVVRELVAIAETHDALLLSDEVYDHFDYSERFESALRIDSEHRIVSNSFSKSMAITGWRVGYAIFPPSLVEAAKTRHMLTNVATSRPAQAAVLHALQHTEPDYYAGNRQLLEQRIQTFSAALESAGASFTIPAGAFYVMAKFDTFPGSLNNVKRLIDDAGVAGMPGEAFGTARSDWIRFALVTSSIETAGDRLRDYFA